MTFFDETSEPVKTEPTQAHISQQWKYEPSPLINCGFDPSGNYVFGTARDFALVRFSLADGAQKVYKGHESWSRGMAFHTTVSTSSLAVVMTRSSGGM